MASTVWAFSRNGRPWVQQVVKPICDKVGKENPEVSFLVIFGVCLEDDWGVAEKSGGAANRVDDTAVGTRRLGLEPVFSVFGFGSVEALLVKKNALSVKII